LSIAFEELRQGKLEIGYKEPAVEADEEEIGAAAAGDDYLEPRHGMGTPSGSTSGDEPTDEGAA
jgi:hypothetical protein